MMHVNLSKIRSVDENCAMETDHVNLAYHPRVYQAQGMVAVQAGCSLDEALALMRNTAEAVEETLERVADEVVNRNVRFD
jgi:AmiR/NasT family two-component response regulator